MSQALDLISSGIRMIAKPSYEIVPLLILNARAGSVETPHHRLWGQNRLLICSHAVSSKIVLTTKQCTKLAERLQACWWAWGWGKASGATGAAGACSGRQS